MVSWIESDGYMAFDNPKFYDSRWIGLQNEQSLDISFAQTVSHSST